MTLHFFPYPGADGSKSEFVRSTTSAEVAQVRDFKCYEQPTVRFKPVAQNPTGAYNARVEAFTATSYTALAYIYTEAASGAPNVLAITATMSWNAGGYFEGVLDLNTDEAIAATAARAAGDPLAVRFCFVMFNPSGEPEIVEQAARLFNTPPPADLPDPTSVTATIFANLLEAALTNTNTLTWLRSGNDLFGHVPLMGAPGILPTLNTSFTVSGTTPSANSGSDSDTVGGVAGERYLIRARVAGNMEIKGYSAGVVKPGDNERVNRDGTVGANNYDKWYLDISSPPQRIYLNNGSDVAPVIAVDYYLEFVADAGATVTVGFDTIDAQSTGNSDATITFVSASQLHGDQVLYQSNSATSALTGTLVETTKATVAIPPMGLSDRVRVALTYSRPAGQVADALVMVRWGGSLAYRTRVGLLRGGVIDLPVISNRASRTSQVLATDSESDRVVGTSAVNTAAATALTVAFVLEDVADSITLEALTVTKIPTP